MIYIQLEQHLLFARENNNFTKNFKKHLTYDKKAGMINKLSQMRHEINKSTSLKNNLNLS